MRKPVISRIFTALFTALSVAIFSVFALVPGANAQPLADEPIGFYEAYIGVQDLYNSKGVRLSSAAQVLRQDRANVHRFGIWQPGDQLDPIFGTLAAREVMTQVLERNGLDP